MSEERLTAVGAYVYAGGFSLGVERAGFDVLCHLEGDNAYGVDSARLNWPDRPIHHGPDRWPFDELGRINVDLAFANPPCAIYSSMGIATTRGQDAWREDPRLAHWWDSFRVLERVRPRAWCLESVTNAYTKGREVIDEMTKRALLGGYSVTHLLLDARWCGIPQSRRRFFIVAHRPARLIGYQHNWAPPPTVGEVLAEVPEPGSYRPASARHLDLVRETAPGERLASTWDRLNPNPATNDRGQRVGRPSFLERRLDPSEVMGAFVGDKYYHPNVDRLIGINEAKALCGYPPDFQLAGNPSGWASLLARAVMPPVGYWLANALRSTLAQPDASWNERCVTLVDVREPDRPPRDLTGQYLDDAGRVRLRARTDGTVSYSLNAVPRPPRVTPTPRSPVVTPPSRSVHETPRRATFDPADPAYRPEPGEGSGRLVQRLWRTTDLSPDELVAVVHANWAGRTTRRGDVYYNYKKLVETGETVRPWPAERGRTARSVTVEPACRVSDPPSTNDPSSTNDPPSTSAVEAFLGDRP
jgi:DNA (cytosine-5)-methyltransferase 1